MACGRWPRSSRKRLVAGARSPNWWARARRNASPRRLLPPLSTSRRCARSARSVAEIVGAVVGAMAAALVAPAALDAVPLDVAALVALDVAALVALDVAALGAVAIVPVVAAARVASARRWAGWEQKTWRRFALHTQRALSDIASGRSAPSRRWACISCTRRSS